jgi:hypothetical protein
MSDYLNFSIKTRKELCNWMGRKLGAPLIKVELHPLHYEDAIDEAIEEFTKYVNQERCWLAYDLEKYHWCEKLDNKPPEDCDKKEIEGLVTGAATDEGFTLPCNVTGIFALESSSRFGQAGGGINTLFSVPNQIWNSGGFGGHAGGLGGNGEWITYEASLQYLDLVERLTASEFTFEYNNRSKKLKLLPNPIKLKMKGHIVFGVNIIRPESEQYGESWVKRYALALAKITLGTIRSKYDGVQMLGGGSLNTSIKDEGITERDQLLEELRTTEGAVPGWFMG